MINFYKFCSHKLDHSEIARDLLDLAKYGTIKRYEPGIVLNIIMKHSVWAYGYARTIMKSRWVEAEKYILVDIYCAYVYAKEVINGRWPEAEVLFIEHAQYAYCYAKYILKERWVEAEALIKQNGEWWPSYREEFRI